MKGKKHETTATINLPGDGWAASCRGYCGTCEVEGHPTDEAAIAEAKKLGWKNGMCPKCQTRRTRIT